MERLLTWRYSIALALVASVLVSGYLLVRHELRTSESNSRIINVAGMQRMLSQRIALLSHIIDMQSIETGNALTELEDAIERMKSNHALLTGPEAAHLMTPALRQHYFDAEGLDAQTTHYLALAERFLGQARQDDIRPIMDGDSVAGLTAAAKDDLLIHLDEAVTMFDRNAAASIRSLAKFEMLLLMIGLSVLVLEALFIFRPAVSHIGKLFRTQERQQKDLWAFGYHVSHDLQGASATARGLIAIASEAVDDGDSTLAVSSLNRLTKSIDQLARLIDGIIDATCGDGSQQDVAPVYLPELIAQIFDRYKGHAGFDEVARDVRLQQVNSVVTVEPVLRRVLDELISNAIRFRDDAGTEPELTIVSDQSHDTIELMVRDNGVGVPASQRERLFAPFARFHNQSRDGLGLGLYIARRSIEMIGGSLLYEPREQGSQFTIQLPRRST